MASSEERGWRGLETIRFRYATEGFYLPGFVGGEIAAAANLSPYHFARAFKRSTGLSPHQYVLRRRIERAKDLLENTELSVGEVSKRVGFASPSHFSQQFRRIVGAVPSSLR